MTRKEKKQKHTKMFSLKQYLLNKATERATKLQLRRDQKNKKHEGHNHGV